MTQKLMNLFLVKDLECLVDSLECQEILAWRYLLDPIVTLVTQQRLLQDNLVCREILAWLYLLDPIVTLVMQQRLLQDNLLLEEPLIVHSLPVLQEQHVKRQRLENNVSRL
jgi:hypothetical protein